MDKHKLLGYVAIDKSVPFSIDHLKRLQELESLRLKGLLKDPSLIAQWQKLHVMYQHHVSQQKEKGNKNSNEPPIPQVLPSKAPQQEVSHESPSNHFKQENITSGPTEKIAPPKVKSIIPPVDNEIPPVGDFTISINDVTYTPTITDVNLPLLSFIRSLPGHQGTKKGCAEGGCGACTVMITGPTGGNPISVNSCLRPLVACNGQKVYTIESIGGEKKGFHPLQERLAAYDGTQCGFCSPGMVMNMYSFLANNPNATKEQIEKNLDGNICRCTGYRPILDAFTSFSTSTSTSNACKKICGKNSCGISSENPEDTHECKNSCKLSKFYDIEELPVPNYTNQPLQNFITHTKSNDTKIANTKKVVSLSDGDTQWLTPTDLPSLYNLMNSNSPTDYRLVFGHTSWGIFKSDIPNIFISLQQISGLQQYSVNTAQNTINFGACISISTFLNLLVQFSGSSNLSPDQKRIFPELIYMVGRVAHVHVRNAGSIGGNLMLANKYSFPSDLCIALMGIGASAWVVDPKTSGGTVVPLDQFVTYDMTGKLLSSIVLPLGKPGQVVKVFKVATRNVNAKSIVNAGASAVVNNGVISNEQPIIAFGNIAQKQKRFPVTEQWLIGKDLKASGVIQQALNVFKAELPTDPGIPYPQYRSGVAASFFYKFCLSLLPSVSANLQSAIERYVRPLTTGEKTYQSDPTEYPVSAPIHKLKGKQQCSGEAQYTDDVCEIPGILHAAFVLTPIANADITKVDVSAALAMTGVVGWVSAGDVPGSNSNGSLPLFATTRSEYAGQPVGIIVAQSQDIADRAAKLVTVTCANQATPIITIADAITANSFYSTNVQPVSVGDVTKGLSESDVVLQGSVRNGWQFHFHLETHTAIVFPNEDGEFVVNSATQQASAIVSSIATVLNIQRSKIQVNTRRCGGGYGGKGENSIAAPCAAVVAAYKFGTPVSIVVDFETTLRMSAHRPEFYTEYSVGVMNDGTVKALKINSYINAGVSSGSAAGISRSFLESVYGPYNFPNILAEIKLAKTNVAAATYTRSPGTSPATFCTERIMEHVANALNMPAADIKRKNFFQKGQTAPDGTKLVYWNLDTIYDQLRQVSDYDARLQAIQEYNSKNSWTKKGIAIVPLRFAARWRGKRMTAMVSILSDGSVLAGHGGIEIGQGIDTKVAQAVAFKLGIPMEIITMVLHNSTDDPEVAGTNGSTTSEICVAAAINACDQLNTTLAPIRQKLGNPTWSQLITAAYQENANLQALGFVNPGPPPNSPSAQYQSYSAVIQEVFVDILTGEHQIIRSDLLFDAGISLNPVVDLGQVEGAFVMGLGLFSTESVEFQGDTGSLTTYNTWTYKPPSYADIPSDFRIHLLKNAPNPVGILSSKLVGEPTVALACVNVFGIQNAIIAALKDAGKDTKNFGLNAPAIPENVFASFGGI